MLPQHPADGDKGPSAATPVPVHGWIQALPLGPSLGQAHAVSATGAPAEGQGHRGAYSGLGWGLQHLVLGSHGSTAAAPSARQTAVVVERVQILALMLTGCVRWGTSLNLSEPHFPQLSMSRGRWRPKWNILSKVGGKEKRNSIEANSSTHNPHSLGLPCMASPHGICFLVLKTGLVKLTSGSCCET